jgi:hypothetical protein
MGDRLAFVVGRIVQLVLQHHPDPDGGTHEQGCARL